MDEFDEDPEQMMITTTSTEKTPENKKTREERVALLLLLALLPIALFVFFNSLSLTLNPPMLAPAGPEAFLAAEPFPANGDTPTVTPPRVMQAEEYCTFQGYKLEALNGQQACIFPDSSSCSASAFFKGNCAYPKNPCTLRPANPSLPPIIPKELERGWYLGSCKDKKKNTPGDWLHIMEGLGKGMWYRPDNETGRACDCSVLS